VRCVLGAEHPRFLAPPEGLARMTVSPRPTSGNRPKE
jgi:hypothetical protein